MNKIAFICKGKDLLKKLKEIENEKRTSRPSKSN